MAGQALLYVHEMPPSTETQYIRYMHGKEPKIRSEEGMWWIKEYKKTTEVKELGEEIGKFSPLLELFTKKAKLRLGEPIESLKIIIYIFQTSVTREVMGEKELHVELIKWYLKQRPSLMKILDEISKKLENNQILSFDDIEKINSIIETSDEKTLNDINILLERDISLRKEKYSVDVIEELYEGEEDLPEDLHERRPRNLKESIYEKIKAIILHEYSRLHDKDTVDFVAGKITYDECIKRTEGYLSVASRLFPRLY